MLIEEIVLAILALGVIALMLSLPIWLHVLPAAFRAWRRMGESKQQQLAHLEAENEALSARLQAINRKDLS
jgi:hypothetical protein